MCAWWPARARQVPKGSLCRCLGIPLILLVSFYVPCRQDPNGLLYYQFEFTIESPKWKRHNVAVLATQVSVAGRFCGDHGSPRLECHLRRRVNLWVLSGGFCVEHLHGCRPFLPCMRRLVMSACDVTACRTCSCCCHCWCCVQDNLLYTLNVQCPQSRWAEDGEALRQAAASLRIKPSGNAQYPGAL